MNLDLLPSLIFILRIEEKLNAFHDYIAGIEPALRLLTQPLESLFKEEIIA